MLKKLFTTLNFILTLGQSAKLNEAKDSYQQKYDQYLALYKKAEEYKKELDEIEIVTQKALAEAKEYLARSEKVIKASVKEKNEINVNHKTQTLDKTDQFKDGLNSSLRVGAGPIVGGSLLLGSWGLVAALGSASTGAVISGLSGVAATNATLAWFGGGALAAGGAGMLGGFIVLFIIFMIPTFYFATRLTIRKTNQYKAEIMKLDNAIIQTSELIHDFPAILSTAEIKKINILNICENFIFVAAENLKILRPAGILKVSKRIFRNFTSNIRYNSRETEALEKLTQSVTLFLTEIRLHING